MTFAGETDASKVECSEVLGLLRQSRCGFPSSEGKGGLFILFVCLLGRDCIVQGQREKALRQYMKRNMKCALGLVLLPHRQKYMPGSGSTGFMSEYFQQAESSLEGCQVEGRDCHTATSI